MAQYPVFDSRNQQGWETTSHDYNLHISSIERMPSVLPDVPRYPSVHRVLNNKVTYEEPEVSKKQKHTSKPAKKVQMLDHDQIIVHDNSGDESIDAETDGFIQQKRKGFQLCNWKTFKLH